MIKKITIILVLVILFGCDQKIGDIELTNSGQDGYYFIEPYYNKKGELAASVYKISDEQVKKVSNTIEGVKKILEEEIEKVELNKIPDGIEFKPSSFIYTLYINEEGKIKKVVSLTNRNEKVDKFVVNEMNDWTMEKYIVDDTPIKYAINWKFELIKPKDKKYLTLLMSNLKASEQIDIPIKDDYFVAVEAMPEPIGGVRAIQEKIKYPEIAKRAGIEGRVYVKAFIDENGDVSYTEILKGLDSGGLNEAAAEAVKNTKFKPGRQKGKPVKVQVVVPILFRLDSETLINKKPTPKYEASFFEGKVGELKNSENAQMTGSIVYGVDRIPLSAVNILLERTDYGAATNEKGEFIINEIPRGEYNLSVKHPVYGSFRSQILYLNAGKTYNINIYIK